MADSDTLRYPIGKFSFPEKSGSAEILSWQSDLEALPAQLRKTAGALSAKQLDTPYRDGGWTARQVIHHVADSHLNAYIRIKLALTEDHPTIKPYDENAWAALLDSKLPVEASLRMVESVHERMLVILRALKPADFDRTVYHPESKRDMSVKFLVALYAWHGKHHLGHVKSIR